MLRNYITSAVVLISGLGMVSGAAVGAQLTVGIIRSYYKIVNLLMDGGDSS